MNDRSTILSRLTKDIQFRAAYIRAKVGVLVPSQIRALRHKSDMPKQADLARAANMWQSQISTFETPGAANMTLDMLARLAAAFRVGLVVKFVPFSEMLRWKNTFSQDEFNVVKIEHDQSFLTPALQQCGRGISEQEHFPGKHPPPCSPFRKETAKGIFAAVGSSSLNEHGPAAVLPTSGTYQIQGGAWHGAAFSAI